MKKLFAFLLVAAMVLSMIGCGETVTDGTGATGETAGYTVSVHSQGGMGLEGIQVYVYADSALTDMVAFDETNENGSVSFSIPKREDYVITLAGVPKGYTGEEVYAFSGNTADITLTSALITDESLSGAVLGVGDVMYDFSVTTPGGEKITLSQMLQEKKMVLLNFWYTTCSWCVTEFPYMEQAYQQYQEDVGIIALDPLGSDNDTSVAAFQAQYGLTFPMAMCPASWAATFGISGYPTSVVIDRYGVICLVEPGAITSLRPFTSVFDHFTAEDYGQKLFGSVSELVTTVKPTYTMDTSENISALLGTSDLPVTYRGEEGESAEYTWPFIAAEKNGESCLKASNQEIEDSYAILYADIELKAGQAVGFDYLASSENSCDVLFVIVDGEDVYQISGADTQEQWKSCYPYVALEDGTYEIALCYLKDSDTNVGDDTVYIKNLRIVAEADIDTASYIPRNAAVSQDGFTYEYVDIFLNAEDGYYHVGSENGPLLLADLMNYTQFNEEKTVWDLAYNGDIREGFYDEIVDFCSYASNSQISGVCTVNEELARLLRIVDENAGFDAQDDKEWLKICRYYANYGTDVQLGDPIAGLAPFSAYKAQLGSGNSFYYDRPIMPRGLLAEFVPEKSGVYRITSHAESQQGVDGWIFSEDRQEMLYYEYDERLIEDDKNVAMLFYMEAGKSYYIDIAFWDIYEVGTIPYDIEYVAREYEVFRLASQGFFTYDTNATGQDMYHLIAGGVDVILGEDGYYYVEEGGKQGSLLYADFTGLTPVFNRPIATTQGVKGMIDMGGFDFSKTENDLYILGVMADHDNDPEKTIAYLKEYWGEDYDANAENYRLEDVLAGRYHGTGEDLTDDISAYLDRIIQSGSEEKLGCVPVDERLAEILQLLMDKYTFGGVDHSWTKLCYYYDYLGPDE